MPHVPSSIASILVVLVVSLQAAPAQAAPCADDARYAPNGSGQGYCLYEDLVLPDAEVSPYCHWLEYGYIGYSWTASPQTASYECPEGARLASNGAGTDFCLFEDLWLPPADDLSSYCTYLEDGYIGYSWTE